MKNKKTALLASITTLAISASSTNAATVIGDIIAIDFGATATTTANYNTISNAEAAGGTIDLMLLSDGSTPGVSLGITGSTQDNVAGVAGNGGNIIDPNIFVDGILGNLNAGAGTGNGPTAITFTFSGLNDSLAYDLVGGTARAADQTNLQNFTANWTAGGTTEFSDALAGGGYVNFTGLTSSGGELTVVVDGAGLFSIVSQLELTAVPEPSSTVLFGLGGLALLARRRR